jgi:serine/threonine protein kinase/tetratricopeptide (TPR) repeat protein
MAIDEKEVFVAALALPDAGEREAYLQAACAGHPELLGRLRELLSAHEESQGPLDYRPAGLGVTVTAGQAEGPGTVIGPYKLLQQIGEGGMGVVWMAEQTRPVQRKVAVKVIKPGMDSRQVVARFEAERQALALMDHVNIARVFDGGATDNGRPYFVMELVHGVPITKYCDDNHLTPRERLELFVPVCQAIQHAHQKGIIHRDVKPSNVMVTLYDGKPVPKVIDFGVAKATEHKLTERTLFTQFGTMVGTFEYMSPEQAEMSALGVDTRSDIYSLGVLLYELLTGSTPLTRQRMKEAAYAEILRMIKEDEPQKPSTRLSDSGEALASIAAQRKTEPAKLSKLVRGELDWIVMKTLEKDRNRRYETANGLAHDVENYLHDEPVQACPPSAGYRLRKFARRHRAPVLGAAVIAVLLLGGIIGTSVGLIQAERARGVAQANAERAEDNFKEARTAVDDMYTQVAEKWLAHQPHLETVQREFLQKALQFYERFAREYSSDPSMRLETARAYRRIGEIQRKLGKAPQAGQAFKKAAESFQELADQFPLAPEYRHELADTSYKLGDHLAETGSIPEAGSAYDKALDLQEKLVAVFPAVPEYRRDLAMGLYSLGKRLIYLRAERSEIEKPFRRSVALMEGLRQESPNVTEYRAYLACGLQALGYYLTVHCHDDQGRQYQNEAIALLEEVTAESPRIPTYRSMLGAAYCWSSEGQPPQEAGRSLRKALEVQRKLAADFPSVSNIRYDVVRSLVMLAREVLEASRADQAEEAYTEAIAIEETLAKETPTIHFYRHRLGLTYWQFANFLSRTGKLPEAEKRYRQCIKALEKLADDFPQISVAGSLDDAYSSFGLFLRSRGRHKEAINLFQEQIAYLSKAIERNANQDDRLRLAQCYCNLGDALAALKQLQDADKAYDHALRLWQHLARKHAEAPDHSVSLGHFLWSRAAWFTATKRLPEAEEAWRSAADVFGALAGKYPKEAFYQREQAWSYRSHGLLLTASDRPQAEKSLRQALDVHKKLVAAFANTAGAAEYRSRLNENYEELIDNLMAQGKIQEAEALALEPAARDLVREAIKRCPENAVAENNLAWHLIKFAVPRRCDPAEALALAQKAVKRAPDVDYFVNTLGVAYYRAGNWKAAIDTLTKADELYGGRLFSYNAFFLAMAHWQRGEKEQALKWYAPALVWMEKVAPKDAHLLRFRAEAAALLGLPEKLTPEQAQARDDDLKYYTLVLEAHPKAGWTYQQRGTAHARLGQWGMAEADLAKTIELNADSPVAWNYLALVRLHRANGDGYRKACTDMLQRFGPTANAEASYWTVWACALAPDAVTEGRVVVQMAEKAVAANPKNCDLLQHLGAVLYRAGRFEDAAKRLTEAESAFPGTKNARSSIVYNWLFQAMTQHRLGHAVEARRYLDKAVKEIDQPSTKAAVAWNRRLTLQLLRLEAQELLRQPSGAKNSESEK